MLKILRARYYIFLSMYIWTGQPEELSSETSNKQIYLKILFLTKVQNRNHLCLRFWRTVHCLCCSVCMYVCMREREIWVAHVCLRNFCSVQHCQCVCVFFSSDTAMMQTVSCVMLSCFFSKLNCDDRNSDANMMEWNYLIRMLAVLVRLYYVPAKYPHRHRHHRYYHYQKSYRLYFRRHCHLLTDNYW